MILCCCMTFCSVPHPFLGDYVRLRQNAQWKKLCISSNDQYIVFADTINKITRSTGKVSCFFLYIQCNSFANLLCCFFYYQIFVVYNFTDCSHTDGIVHQFIITAGSENVTNKIPHSRHRNLPAIIEPLSRQHCRISR